jgi:acyl dehydratase
MEEGRWLKPVYAGETLTGRATVLSRRVSSKRPEMGILKMKFELFNTAGELKAELTGVQFMKVRHP